MLGAMAHYIIYVPGLGDHRAALQRMAVRLWRLYGVTGVFYPMNWNDGQPFAPKLRGLLDSIDKLTAGGNKVSLVSASAGASAALAAYKQRTKQISGVACLCGKINREAAVNPSYFYTNPAFKESLAAMVKAIARLSAADKARILSARPLYDEIVSVEDAVLAGTQSWIMPVAGHGISIGYGLTLGFWHVLRFLRTHG
jgi:hypothetical protein